MTLPKLRRRLARVWVWRGGRWLIARRRVLNEFIPNRNSGPGNPVREMDAAAQAARVGD